VRAYFLHDRRVKPLGLHRVAGRARRRREARARGAPFLQSLLLFVLSNLDRRLLAAPARLFLPVDALLK
jgi:hypothetical protein